MLDAAFSSSSAHHIVDSLVVGQAIQGGVDERVVLFVKLADGRVLDDALCKAVKTEVRGRRTARHVPEKVLLTKFHALYPAPEPKCPNNVLFFSVDLSE